MEETSALDLKEISAIKKVIEDKKWNPELWGQPIVNRLAGMLEHLEKPKRALIIELLKHYVIVTDWGYVPLMQYSLNMIDDAHMAGRENIFLLPMVKEKDVGKPKSGYHIFSYLERAMRGDSVSNLYNPSRYNTLPSFSESESKRSNSLILLCDDFVGTGNTAVSAIDYFKRSYAVSSDRIAVLCLVAMNEGLKRVRDSGHEIIFGCRCFKGISESSQLRSPEEALRLMDAIEQVIGVHPDYQRGYGASEALVTMNRTPNNTFPVFWYNGEWPAPFPRH